MLVGEDIKNNLEIEKNLIKLLFTINKDFYQNGEFFRKHFINTGPFENDAFILALYMRFYSTHAHPSNSLENTVGSFLNDSKIFNEFLKFYLKSIVKMNNNFDREVDSFTRYFNRFKNITLYNRNDFKGVVSKMRSDDLNSFVQALEELKERREQIKLIKFVEKIYRDYDELSSKDIENIKKSYESWGWRGRDAEDFLDRCCIVAKSMSALPEEYGIKNNFKDFKSANHYIAENTFTYIYHIYNFFNGDYKRLISFHNAFIEYCEESAIQNYRWSNNYSTPTYHVQDIIDNYVENAPIEWSLELAAQN